MIIGLEIEPSFVKAALVRKKGGYELIGWEIFELPEGVVKNTGIADIDTLLRTLIKIPPKFNIKNPEVAYCITGPTNCAIRIIEVPYIDSNEIDLNLPTELDKYVPFSIKEIYYDYHIIAKNKNSSKIIVAVALKEIVNDYANILEKAGMIPKIADLSSLALYNVYEVNYSEGGLSIIMNIGEHVINSVIAKGYEPLYIRESINSSHVPIENSTEDEIRNYADEVAAEIYRQIEYFKTISSESNVEEVYVTGSPTSSTQFIQFLQERLDVVIKLFNPFKKIKISKELSTKMQNFAPLSAISIGASLRGTEKIK